MKNYLIIWVIALGALLSACTQKQDLKVLVFSKTEGFRHASIEDGKIALLAMAKEKGFTIDTTEDASVFQQKKLQNYNVVVFLSTTGNILNESQQLEFQRFIQAGGGYVGIHAAADTEYEWPWYGKLVGGYFNGHPNNPNVREADIQRIDKEHISTSHLPDKWHRNDEWYNYKNLNPNMTVLLNLDESTYQGGTNGESHPIAWYHEFDGGRAWYTGGGHTSESFDEPEFLTHIWGGIQYAAGDGKVNYDLPNVAPEENRFVKHTLDDFLAEPMELELLPDGKILFVERRGSIKVYDPKVDSTTTIQEMNVFSQFEDGLLGLALDPKFEENNWVYLFYSHPEKVQQNISRFTLGSDYMSIDLASEKVLLEVPTQRETCCHSAGSMEFGPNGNLFISLGDDTNPFQSDGYSPSDERAGRKSFDARRTSANTMDLRGKILRIHPEPDGTYSIPEGNLFSDSKEGRPEIYVMGCRNPFRIAIDQRTGFLYWGDVGPDAQEDSTGLGPKGHDEVNQARAAGFFGWPLFVGNNKAYHKRSFAKQVAYEAFDPAQPVNESPNNTGAKVLPAAQPAFIWYPYGKSEEFPLLGTGGRNAMAGPVFYADDYEDNPGRFPVYYDEKLITYDWIRGFLMAVTMNEAGDFMSMERIMPSHKFSNPTDIVMSPKGDIYMLEYGTVWFSRNPDARLVHIEYISGNRKPVADFEADKKVGAAPLTVAFNSAKSVDFDNEALQYEWYFEGFDKVQSSEANPSHTFTEAGTYSVHLIVKDQSGASSEKAMKILVGNEKPQLAWNVKGNTSFFFGDMPMEYNVEVSDKEDGKLGEGIDPKKVAITIDYLEEGYDANMAALGHQEATLAVLAESLMESSDCYTCHQVNKASIGPTYVDVANKYKDDNKAVQYLGNKIINGGGGVWGDRAMAAHPTLTDREARTMARYILSLAKSDENSLPTTGAMAFDLHKKASKKDGTYLVTASYTDKGGEKVGSLTAQEMLVLRSPVIQAIDFSSIEKAMKFTVTPEQSKGLVKEDTELIIGTPASHVVYNNIDLTGIKSIRLNTIFNPEFFSGGTIEIRTDSTDGDVIAEYKVGTDALGFVPMAANLKATQGKHNLYVVFKANEGEEPQAIIGLLSLEFSPNTVRLDS